MLTLFAVIPGRKVAVLGEVCHRIDHPGDAYKPHFACSRKMACKPVYWLRRGRGRTKVRWTFECQTGLTGLLREAFTPPRGAQPCNGEPSVGCVATIPRGPEGPGPSPRPLAGWFGTASAKPTKSRPANAIARARLQPNPLDRRGQRSGMRRHQHVRARGAGVAIKLEP